jgi:hypothetical protein
VPKFEHVSVPSRHVFIVGSADAAGSKDHPGTPAGLDGEMRIR